MTVHEYAANLAPRYRAGRRAEKGRVLDEFCATTGMHRKAAIRLLGWVGPKLARRSRKRLYGPAVVEVLRCLWEVGDRMCGKLLVAAIPDLMAALERHGELRVSPQVRTALLAVSPATVDRLLHPFRLKRRRQPLRASAASPSLKSQVPIRTWSQWQGVRPGSLQADLVLHCGESVEGFYLTTLTAVDVATGWTELQAVWGMGKGRVSGAPAPYPAKAPLPSQGVAHGQRQRVHQPPAGPLVPAAEDLPDPRPELPEERPGLRGTEELAERAPTRRP